MKFALNLCLQFYLDSASLISLNELQLVVIEWNTHRIDARHNRQGVAGIPDVLFFMPEQEDAQSYHAGICEQDL